MLENKIIAKEIEKRQSYLEIVSELEKTIESIDTHALRKDIVLAFDTNIDEYYANVDYDFINKKLKKILCKYIDEMQYGKKLNITLFASEVKAKLNINEEELSLSF